MNRIKLAIVFTSIFAIHLIMGCNCEIDKGWADFNYLTIENIDNSGRYPMAANSDSMYAESVAFRITVKDTTTLLYAACSPRAGFGFMQAQAFQCECFIKYFANQRIENISIHTLYPVSVQVAQGTDVTHLFVASPPGYYYSSEKLYISNQKLLELVNGNSYCDMRPAESFNLYLNVNAESEVARFVVSVLLSDGRILSDTTALIHLVH